MKLKNKKYIYIFTSLILTLSLCVMPMFAYGRKLVGKNVSGSFSWSAYSFSYSFRATAGLTYNNSNNLTSISDLSFSGISCKSSNSAVAGSIIPKQTRKSYSGKTATYVVTLTRTAQGFYTDKVNYTLTYRSTDAGTPYSFDEDDNEYILVEVEESEPYDIQLLNN